VLATAGNTNNHIGVPQNLLKLNELHRFAVLEAGTSSPGEITPLSKLITPRSAVVNSIAPCHLEKLISLEGVAREKGCIFDGCSKDGCAIIPLESAGNEILRSAAENRRIYTFGSDSRADFYSIYLGGSLSGSRFELHTADGNHAVIEWQLCGAHQALNAAAAAAAAYSLGIDSSVIFSALPATLLPGMRNKISRLNGSLYINDAYNANPASMASSLKSLAESFRSESIPTSNAVLVLGGMRELGAVSAESHREIRLLARELFKDAVIILIGSEFADCGNEIFFASSAEAAGAVAEAAGKGGGKVIFAKGSRGSAVELALPPEAR
jgi:UDP-N-acetylmuramoyl-tripeptide--D-alanyl-D-alanine ligase